MGVRSIAKPAAYRLSALYWRIRSRGKIEGQAFRIRRPERVRISKHGRLVIGEGAVFDTGCRLVIHGHAEIGPRAAVGRDCVLVVYDRLTIGAETLLAERVSIHGAFHDWASPLDGPLHHIAPTSVGSRCWLGANVVQMPGTTIGDNTIVGANSVVSRDLPVQVVAVGAPAREIRRNDHSAS